MVYTGLEGPGERQKAGGSAGERMADWCALARWQKSCRIRVFSYVVSGLDDLKSNHIRIAPCFYDFLCCAKSTGSQPWLCTIPGFVTPRWHIRMPGSSRDSA